MRKRSAIALVIFLIVICMGLVYETSLLKNARTLTWQFFVANIANMLHLSKSDTNEATTQQLNTLKAENIRLHSELNDYQIIKKQLGTPSFESFRVVQASVLARPIDTFQTEYIISKGVLEGVIPGAPVTVNGSILVGFISETTEHTSTLRLLLHPKNNVTAQIITDEHNDSARGLLVGKQFTSLLLTTIPRDVDVKKDQQVVTAGNEIVPSGLSIGSIDTISNKENEPYQQAILKLPYDPGTLSAVNILIHP